MQANWYVKLNGRTLGPLSFSKLKALAEAGRISGRTWVREGTVGDWVAACDVSSLFPKHSRSRQDGSHHRTHLIAGASSLIAVAVTVIVMLCALRRGDDRPGPDPPEVRSDDTSHPTPSPLPAAPAVAVGTGDEPAPAPAVAPPPLRHENEPEATPVPAVAAISPERNQPPEQVPIPEAVLPPDIEPILPPVPKTKQPISDREITSLHESLSLQHSAKSAYRIYQQFAESYAFTPEQQSRVDAQLAIWRDRAEKNLFRHGGSWVTLEELSAARERAHALIERAVALLGSSSWAAAIETLEEASKVDQNGIRADYLLGLLRSLPLVEPGLRGAKLAEKHFRTVLRRYPNHPEALNSLAISLVKQHNYLGAYNCFEQAAELAASHDEIAQNLGRFVYLAEQRRIAANTTTIRKYANLYAQLVSEKKAKPFDSNRGWLHMIPVLPDNGPKEGMPPQQVPPDAIKMLLTAHGSGFVVAPEFVLTNRHVVLTGRPGAERVVDEVRITVPAGPNSQELIGRVSAIAKDTDLAVVHFPGLKLRPLLLDSRPPRLASDVLIMGYPMSDLLGTGLKTTRGVISGLPDPTRPDVGGYLLFDAASDHGNSGGPVMTSRG